MPSRVLTSGPHRLKGTDSGALRTRDSNLSEALRAEVESETLRTTSMGLEGIVIALGSSER